MTTNHHKFGYLADHSLKLAATEYLVVLVVVICLALAAAGLIRLLSK